MTSPGGPRFTGGETEPAASARELTERPESSSGCRLSPGPVFLPGALPARLPAPIRIHGLRGPCRGSACRPVCCGVEGRRSAAGSHLLRRAPCSRPRAGPRQKGCSSPAGWRPGHRGPRPRFSVKRQERRFRPSQTSPRLHRGRSTSGQSHAFLQGGLFTRVNSRASGNGQPLRARVLRGGRRSRGGSPASSRGSGSREAGFEQTGRRSVVPDAWPPHALQAGGLLVPWDPQAEILQWVAISSSGGSSPPRDQTQVCMVGGFLTG